MDEIGSLIQSGGAETMGMLNQSGGVAMVVVPAIRTVVPIIFFFVYFFCCSDFFRVFIYLFLLIPTPFIYL